MRDTDGLLTSTASRIFADRFPPTALFQAEGGIWQSAGWEAIEQAGLPMALVPVSAGGYGVDPLEALDVLRIAGEFAVPAPLAETMLAAWWLAVAGLECPPGPMTIAPVSGGDEFVVNPVAAGWRLSGHATRVPWARAVKNIAVVCRYGGEVFIARLPAAMAGIDGGVNLALEPRDSVRVDCVLPADAVGQMPAGFGPEGLRLAGSVVRCMAVAGALRRVLDMTVTYAGDRIQFGRPIGNFQAIQQNLAIMAGQVAAGVCAADTAADALRDGLRPLPIMAAKLRSGEAAGIVASLAHQIHGAIGFTHEHSLHFFTKRLWSWREEFGSDATLGMAIGRAAAAAGADSLWASITAF